MNAPSALTFALIIAPTALDRTYAAVTLAID